MENSEAPRIPRGIEHYFGFLHDRGYRLRQVEYSEQTPGNWVVTFESSTMKVCITNDSGRIIVELASSDLTGPSRRIPIERLISVLSGGRNIVVPFRNSMAGGKQGQMERLAHLLQQHIDQITGYFAERSRVIRD